MILKLENINFSFAQSKPILNNLTLSLEQGKIYALMGANGAGKSTLFNIITGFIKPQSGKIIFNETEITKSNVNQITLNGIGRTFQDLRLITKISVKENIELCFKNNLSDKWYNTIFPSTKLKVQKIEFTKRINEILEQFHLVEVQDQLGGEISYGQQKLLTIASCVANDAQLLLLDEPVAGINPIYREQLIHILKLLKEQGKTILLIEHNTDFIKEVANEIFFLHEGNLTTFESIEALRNNQEVLNSYL